MFSHLLNLHQVVGLDVPADSVGGFAEEYFALFGKDLDRPDKVFAVNCTVVRKLFLSVIYSLEASCAVY
jgi:hypothetical protein